MRAAEDKIFDTAKGKAEETIKEKAVETINDKTGWMPGWFKAAAVGKAKEVISDNAPSAAPAA